MRDSQFEDGDEPSAIGLFNCGLAYIETGRAVAQNCRIKFRDPHEFLFSHGLELILNADLRRLMSMKAIKRGFCHNLNKLLDGVSTDFSQHYGVDDGFRTIIAYLAEGHSSAPYRSRYIQIGARQVIDIAEIKPAMVRFHGRDREFLNGFFTTANDVS